MSTSEHARGAGAEGTGGTSGALGDGVVGSPGQLGDLERPAIAPEAADAVRGGAALPQEKRRQIANDTIRVL